MSTQKQYIFVTVHEPKVETHEVAITVHVPEVETRTVYVTVHEPEVEPHAVAVTLLKPPKAENYLANVAVHQPPMPGVYDTGASALPEEGISLSRVPICEHGHLREALLDTLDWDCDPWYTRLKDQPDVLDCHSAEQQNTWDHMTGEERADWLCGQLRNCGDILPSFVASEFDLQRNTYAALVRYLRPLIRQTPAQVYRVFP